MRLKTLVVDMRKSIDKVIEVVQTGESGCLSCGCRKARYTTETAWRPAGACCMNGRTRTSTSSDGERTQSHILYVHIWHGSNNSDNLHLSLPRSLGSQVQTSVKDIAAQGDFPTFRRLSSITRLLLGLHRSDYLAPWEPDNMYTWRWQKQMTRMRSSLISSQCGVGSALRSDAWNQVLGMHKLSIQALISWGFVMPKAGV